MNKPLIFHLAKYTIGAILLSWVFTTAHILLFESSSDGKYAEYMVCNESDWAEEGEYCISESPATMPLGIRIKNEINKNAFIWGILGFFLSAVIYEKKDLKN